MSDKNGLFQLDLKNTRIAIIGLGYVGLPLAVAFGKKFDTIGFDIDPSRISELKTSQDNTGEVDKAELLSAKHLNFSSNQNDLSTCNIYIISVPTPIDSNHQPNLDALVSASNLIGQIISVGDLVIYESTVYPGATEDDCLPVIEQASNLKYNTDFFAGYSPERINPGDKSRPLTKIMKVTSGSTPEVAEFVDTLYGSIIDAGTYKASSIKVAEASKVIENVQRDVNIALINELSILFDHLEIDTTEVLDAAATKWNFNRYTPGLVGGHCIGVDPYYLVHKSLSVGYIPDIIRLSREINDGMPRNATARLVKVMIQKEVPIKKARVLLMGLTFKENCTDIRNTKMVELILNLESYGMQVDVYDPWVNPSEATEKFSLDIMSEAPKDPEQYDVVILGVTHAEFLAGGIDMIHQQLKPNGVFFDMKSAFDCDQSDLRL